MKKLTSEWTATIEAPADFVEGYMLEVRNWKEMAGAIPVVRSVVKAPECTWEGEPWQPGSTIVMRSAAVGIPMTVRCQVVQPEEGELCRYTQQMGLPLSKQTFTYTYSIAPLAAATCELTYRAYVEGWAARLSPTIKNPQWGPARTFAAVIEEAWQRSRDPGQDRRSTEKESVPTARAGNSTARSCAACGKDLPPEAVFCHVCGAQVSKPNW